MPQLPTLPDLRNILSKLAKTNRAQAALPPAMRGALPIAIVAGSVLAKVTNGDNFIERQLLGKPSIGDDSIALPEPRKELPDQSATERKDQKYGVGIAPEHKE